MPYGQYVLLTFILRALWAVRVTDIRLTCLMGRTCYRHWPYVPYGPYVLPTLALRALWAVRVTDIGLALWAVRVTDIRLTCLMGRTCY